MPYDFHPIADIFPMMEGDAFDALVADIRAHGLREPITLYEGKVLDGRNRCKACDVIGIGPATKEFAGTPLEAIEFVWSENAERRHLDSSQRAAADTVRERLTQVYKPVREDAKKRTQAGQTKGGKTAGRGRHKDDRSTEQIPASNQRSDRETRSIRAKIAGTNPKYIDLTDKLAEEDPDTFEQVRMGKKTLTQVQREQREAKREKRRKQNAEKAEETPDILSVGAKFATILIDPPWDVSDEGDVNQLGRAKADYHTMSIEQLAAMPVGQLSDEDCHLYCWVTNRSMPKVFGLLEVWGFRYVTLLTWPKPSFGMGNYFRGQTEHIAFGVKGSQMLKRKDASTLLPRWERGKGGHSSKPVEIHEFIESCSPGPYLEVFSRVKRDGWTVWGADIS